MTNRTLQGRVPSWSILNLLALLVIVVTVMAPVVRAKARGAVPEASSTLLKMHKQYMRKPPHDSRLYDVLEVAPNATYAQITKAYHRLSRKYHPDKLMGGTEQGIDYFTDGTALRDIQEAYDVLKDDSTRLPYHKYGLVDTSLVVVLLMGPRINNRSGKISADKTGKEALLNDLLKLMGYDAASVAAATCGPRHPPPGGGGGIPPGGGDEEHTHMMFSPAYLHRQRVSMIAARLVEKIRPLVEGTINEAVIAHTVAEECNRLKSLPLGSQIIRCIGRAYRHTGEHHLMLMRQDTQTCAHSPQSRRTKDYISLFKTPFAMGVKHQWRQAKRYWTAALAGGRLVLTEKIWAHQERLRQMRRQERITKGQSTPLLLQTNGETPCDENEEVSNNELISVDDIKEQERLKARQAVLHILQVEALWKISKINLYKTIQEACQMILSGEYFFFPSHQSSNPLARNEAGEEIGWVSSTTGRIVYADVARHRAAASLMMVGDIMVRCSK